MDKYVCWYWYAGEQQCVHIEAHSADDAKARLKAMSRGWVQGKHLVTVPARFAFIVNFLVRCRII